MPSGVHSENPISATRRGSTQCTPDRGSLPRSKGGWSRSQADHLVVQVVQQRMV